jgi:hypothetical protein
MAVSQIINASLASGVPGKANLPTGSVLQVVQGTTSTTTSTSTATWVTTNLTVSITPTSSSSKILVIVSAALRKGSSAGSGPSLAIYRNTSSAIVQMFNNFYNLTGAEVSGMATLSYLDSPATTSSTSYSLYFRSSNNSNTVVINPDSETASIIAMEIAA